MRAVAYLFQVLLQRRMQQLLRLRLIKRGGRDESHTGVYTFFDRLSQQMIQHGLHTEFAHAKRILYDDAIKFFVAYSLREDGTGVEAYEVNLAGLPRVFESQQRACGG